MEVMWLWTSLDCKTDSTTATSHFWSVTQLFCHMEYIICILLRSMIPWRGRMSVIQSVTRAGSAKTAERIDVLFGVETPGNPPNKHGQALGLMRPLPNYFGHLLGLARVSVPTQSCCLPVTKHKRHVRL